MFSHFGKCRCGVPPSGWTDTVRVTGEYLALLKVSLNAAVDAIFNSGKASVKSHIFDHEPTGTPE